MKPVYQDTFGFPRGNCQAAAIASIVEVDLHDVYDDPDAEWTERLKLHDKFLKEKGFYMMTVLGGVVSIPGYSIAGVPSQKYPGIQHAVVMFDGKIVHDPRKDNDPYPEDIIPFDYSLIIPMNPVSK